MFRYRMSSKPSRAGWVVLIIIVGLLLIILAGQIGRAPSSSPQPAVTQNTASGAGGALLRLWDDVKTGTSYLWSKLTGAGSAKQVDVNLDPGSITLDGAGDDEEDTAAGDVTVEVANPQPPEAFVPAGTSPQILIYHTHSYEAYAKQDGQDYVETAQWRTKNNDFNVAKVGEELSRQLSSKYGIAVLHDVTDNEYPQLGTAYTRSLQTVQKDMAANPDLKILIDLHRDAFNAGIDPSTVTINGQKVARIMIVIGTGVGQTGVGFAEKPDWNKNLLLASAITDKLNEFDPQLARKVDIKTGRYNQHVSPGAILVEVGHNQNTLDEALAAVPFLAQAIAEVYDSMAESGGLVSAAAPTTSAGASLAPGATASPTQSYAPVTPADMPSPSPSAPVQQVIVIEPDATAKPAQSPQNGG